MKTTLNNSYIKFNVQLPNGKIVEITLPLVESAAMPGPE
jgi:hypothetical protein